MRIGMGLLAVAGLLLAGVSTGWAAAAGACRPGFRLALDTGHTLAQPGATSASGSTEFLFNRRLAEAVAEALDRAGVPFVLIGADGGTLRLPDRPRQAAAAGATLFLSLHHDSVQPQYLEGGTVDGRAVRFSDRFHGFALFVGGSGPRAEASLRFARTLGTALEAAGLVPSLYHAEEIPGENRKLLDRALGIHRFDGLLVLRDTAMPAVLLEAGVIVNRAEEARFLLPDFRRRVAEAIAGAVARSCS